MGTNILRAILNISSFGNFNLKNYSSNYLNRVNAVGDQLEFYIRDSLASSFKLSQEQKEETYQKTFSWLGNQNHPPDLIVKESDAFEIKKIEGLSTEEWVKKFFDDKKGCTWKKIKCQNSQMTS